MPLQYLKVSDIYALPGQEPVNEHWFTNTGFRRWVPELTLSLSDATLLRIHEAGRLVAKLVDSYQDGGDFSEEMVTLWFDSQPFAVIRDYGRENRSRWVTDPKVLGLALAYIVTQFAADFVDNEDVRDYVSPESKYHAEEIFGRYLGKKFDVERTKLDSAGLMLIGEKVISTMLPGEILVFSQRKDLPLLIRRGEYYARYARALDDADFEANPNVHPDNVSYPEGYDRAFIYMGLDERPADFESALSC